MTCSNRVTSDARPSVASVASAGEGKDPDLDDALEAFRRAARPNQELTKAVQELQLSTEYTALVDAGESVLRKSGSWSLDWLPRAVANKAFSLAVPNMLECDRLRKKVQDLAAQQQATGRAYLQELATLRSKVRQTDDKDLEFGAEDRYYWDALDAVPEELRHLVMDVIVEKLRCFTTQPVAATITELQTVMRQARKQIPELESCNSELLQQLTSAKHLVSEQENRLKAHAAQVKDLGKTRFRLEQSEIHNAKLETELEAVRRELSLVDQAVLLGLKDDVQNTQRNLVDVQSALTSQAKSFEHDLKRLSELCASLRASVEDMSTESGQGRSASDSQSLVPTLVEELVNWPRFECVGNCLSAVIQQLDDTARQLSLERDMATTSRAEAQSRQQDLQLQLRDSRLRIEDLERDLTAQRDTASDLDRQCADLRNVVSRLVGRLDVEETPVYQELKQRCEQLQEDLHVSNAQIVDLQMEVERNARAKNELEAACHHAETHQLHPARVAQVRAELQRIRVEWQAALKANAALRSALKACQQKTGESTGGAAEKTAYVLNSCSRTVFNRLHEDALRRHEHVDTPREGPLADRMTQDNQQNVSDLLYDGMPEILRVQNVLKRCCSDPEQLQEDVDIQEMMVLNARSLKKMHGREVPLISVRRRQSQCENDSCNGAPDVGSTFGSACSTTPTSTPNVSRPTSGGQWKSDVSTVSFGMGCSYSRQPSPFDVQSTCEWRTTATFSRQTSTTTPRAGERLPVADGEDGGDDTPSRPRSAPSALQASPKSCQQAALAFQAVPASPTGHVQTALGKRSARPARPKSAGATHVTPKEPVGGKPSARRPSVYRVVNASLGVGLRGSACVVHCK